VARINIDIIQTTPEDSDKNNNTIVDKMKGMSINKAQKRKFESFLVDNYKIDNNLRPKKKKKTNGGQKKESYNALLDNDNFIMESIKLEKKVMKKDVDFESFVTGKEVEVKVRMSSTNPVSPHPRFDASYSNRNINFDQSRKKIFLPKNDVCLYAVAITDWGFSSSSQGYMWKYIVDDIGDNDDIYFGLIIRNKINPDNISEIKELGSNNFSWGYCPGKGIYKHNEKISNSNKKKR